MPEADTNELRKRIIELELLVRKLSIIVPALESMIGYNAYYSSEIKDETPPRDGYVRVGSSLDGLKSIYMDRTSGGIKGNVDFCLLALEKIMAPQDWHDCWARPEHVLDELNRERNRPIHPKQMYPYGAYTVPKYTLKQLRDETAKSA